MFGIDVTVTAARCGIDNFFRAVQSFLYGIVLPKASGNGIKVDTDSPSFGYHDILGDVEVRGPGANDPTWAVLRGNLYAWEFSATINKEVWIVYHIPHDYVPGTPINFHAHWVNKAAVPNTGTVIWGFEYSYARGYDQDAFPATATVTVSKACHATRYEHQISETGDVTIANMEPDGLIVCRVYRDAAADTCTDTVQLLTADVHYRSSGIGTKAKNAPFYT